MPTKRASTEGSGEPNTQCRGTCRRLRQSFFRGYRYSARRPPPPQQVDRRGAHPPGSSCCLVSSGSDSRSHRELLCVSRTHWSFGHRPLEFDRCGARTARQSLTGGKRKAPRQSGRLLQQVNPTGMRLFSSRAAEKGSRSSLPTEIGPERSTVELRSPIERCGPGTADCSAARKTRPCSVCQINCKHSGK